MGKLLLQSGNPTSRRLYVYALCLVFALSGPVSLAQQAPSDPDSPAGHIVVVIGEVVARGAGGGSDRQLLRRSEVFEGDTIYTAANASAQIRMIDGALIALNESTEFAFLEYRYAQDPDNDASTLELIQGGFRTISGGIGTQNRASYETRISNFATIGIRGTDYEVFITDQGNLLTGVYDGGTTISNNAGQLDLGIGADYDYAEIPNQETPPRGLLVQPIGLGNTPFAVVNDTDGDDSEEDNGNAAGATPAAGGGNGNGNTPNTPAANTASSGNNANAANQNTSLVTAPVNIPPPSTAEITATPAANIAGNQITTNLQAAETSAITINPAENQTKGSVSCATDSNLCVQLTNGQVLNQNPPVDAEEPGSGSGSDSGGNNGGNSGNAGGGNSGNAGGGNSGNAGGGNSGNNDNAGGGNSGNAGGGNSGNAGGGNSGNNDNAGGGNSGNAGGGNSGNAGGGNSGNAGGGNSGNNDNAGGGNSGNAGGGNSGNNDNAGGGNSGNAGGGSSGNDTGGGNSGNSGGGSSGNDTGGGNSGNSGGGSSGNDTGGGNSGNSGGGSSGNDTGGGNSGNAGGGSSGNDTGGGNSGNAGGGSSGNDTGGGNSGNAGGGSSGNDTGGGNSGNSGGGSSGNDTGGGNSGNSGGGSSGNDTGGGNSGNSGGGSSGNDTGGGNSGNSGGGSSGNDTGGGNSGNSGGGSSGNDTGGGNSGNAGGGSSGNDTGGGNSGNAGGGSSGNDTGGGNSGGGSSGNDTGGGNSGNSGGGSSGNDTGGGNSGNSGGGNSGGGNNGGGNGNTPPPPEDLRLTRPESSIDELGISWGKWDTSLEENWIVIAKVEQDLVLLSTGDYFASVNPTDVAKLTGSHHYSTGIASSFIGSGSGGDISQLVANMDVDFATGIISNGNLMLSVADHIWSVEFGGFVQHGNVDLNIASGMLMESGSIISQSVDGSIGGVFTGAEGAAFVGGFDLLDQLNPFNNVEGLFTLER